MKITIGLSALAIGYLLTSTTPVHASPVRSAHVFGTTGHEIQPEFLCLDSSATAGQAVATGLAGAGGGAAGGAVGLALGAAVGAAGGWVAGTLGYFASHLTSVLPQDDALLVLPPNVDRKHIAALSEARLDASPQGR